MCEVILVDVVVDDVRVVALQVVDDDNGNGNDDVARSALMHAKEKASKDDKKRVVGQVVVNKDVYGDVDVNEELVVEEVVAEDVEDEEGLVNTCDANVDGDVQDVNVEVAGFDDVDVLKVGDADGKVPLKT